MKKIKGPMGRPKWEFTKAELINLLNEYGTTRAVGKAIGVSHATIGRRLAEEDIVLKWVDGSKQQ